MFARSCQPLERSDARDSERGEGKSENLPVARSDRGRREAKVVIVRALLEVRFDLWQERLFFIVELIHFLKTRASFVSQRTWAREVRARDDDGTRVLTSFENAFRSRRSLEKVVIARGRLALAL